MVYSDGVSSCHGKGENTVALLVASKETGIAINTEKTKCMFMSRDQHAEQNHNIEMGNTLFETVWQFRYCK